MESLLKITNAPFQIEFMDKPYMVKKASLDQVIKFMKKMEDLRSKKTPNLESSISLVSYAMFISLSAVDPTITEEFVQTNMPGTVDATDVLTILGFITPKQATLTKAKVETSTTASSSPSSPSVQDGDPTKSPVSA
jgi:hypothetical protein